MINKPTKITPAPKPVYLTYEDYPIEDLLTYAGIDCLVTSGLASKLMPILSEEPKYTFFTGKSHKKVIRNVPSMISSYENYTAPALEFIVDMELNGFLYDVKRNAEVKLQMEKEIEKLETQIFSAIGKRINLDSGDILGNFLYVEKGFEVNSRTKTGEPSTDGAAVLAIAKDHPELTWLPLLAKRNDISSLYRTFVANYVKDFVKSDGRIHPSYNLHGTGSFRLSGEEPNLTQLANPKHGYNIREFYGVPDGCVFLAADYSSAEVKILGALCRDEKLLQAIAEGKDFHSYSASEMHGIDYEEFVSVLGNDQDPKYKSYKRLRQGAKSLTFSIIFGSSTKAIALGLGVSEEEALRLIGLYFDNFPGIGTYVENSHLMAQENHYVMGPFYQRKQTFGAQDVFKGTAVYNGAKRLSQNVRVQNTASSFGLYNFAKLNSAIKVFGGKSICSVYDSLETEIPFSYIAQAVDLTFVHLEDNPVQIFDWLTLPVTIDVEIGFNWGVTKHVKRGATQAELEEILDGLRTLPRT